MSQVLLFGMQERLCTSHLPSAPIPEHPMLGQQRETAKQQFHTTVFLLYCKESLEFLWRHLVLALMAVQFRREEKTCWWRDPLQGSSFNTSFSSVLVMLALELLHSIQNESLFFKGKSLPSPRFEMWNFVAVPTSTTVGGACYKEVFERTCP